MVINLNFDEDKGASKVYQSETSNLQRYVSNTSLKIEIGCIKGL